MSAKAVAPVAYGPPTQAAILAALDKLDHVYNVDASSGVVSARAIDGHAVHVRATALRPNPLVGGPYRALRVVCVASAWTFSEARTREPAVRVGLSRLRPRASMARAWLTLRPTPPTRRGPPTS
jgi:hypothetical protein